MIFAQLFEVDLDLAYLFALTVGLYILHLHLQVLDAPHNVERDDFIPDGVIRSRHFLCVRMILLHAEAHASIDRNSGLGRVDQLTSIDNVHRQNAPLHDVLVWEARVHII